MAHIFPTSPKHLDETLQRAHSNLTAPQGVNTVAVLISPQCLSVLQFSASAKVEGDYQSVFPSNM